MAHDSARNLTRERIAHLAARLMAQDGIEDYAMAKRKAARQAGIAETRQLPNNDEIDAALKLYRTLYQRDHPARLRELRQLALKVMDDLAEFNPHLTGSVLKGNAGQYATIQLQLFTDNDKSVEHYLLNHGIAYSSNESRLYAGARPISAPVLIFERDAVEIHVTLLSSRDQRTQLKANAEGKPLERATRAAVETLIAASY